MNISFTTHKCDVSAKWRLAEIHSQTFLILDVGRLLFLVKPINKNTLTSKILYI